MIDVHHRTTTVNGHEVFYREAGHADAPVVLLLHGFPTSSRMFRNLIPALADRYHVIAPDHLGFGHSATPPADEFTYTFDALTDITQGLLDQLGIDRFTMYVQDYGAPIGWRLALRQPTRVHTIISQSGNAYDEGFVPDFWAPIWAYAQAPGPDTEACPPRCVRARRHPLAVRHRGARARPGRPRHLAPRPHRSCAAPGTTRSNSTSSATTPPTRPSTPPSRSTSARARCPHSRSGAQATRSSDPTAQRPSAGTFPTPRSTSSKVATSCSRAPSTRWPDTSAGSSAAPSPEALLSVRARSGSPFRLR